MFCGAVFADSVESQNIVGYTTSSLSSGVKDISGVPFVNAGATTFSIQNITLSNGTDGSDWIMVFNPNTRAYDEYTWFAEVYTDDSYSTSLGVPGWGNNYVKIDCELDPGQGFWIRTEADSDMTLPGQVVAGENNSFSTKAGVKDIVACVFPTAVSIQDITLTGGTDGSDWIMVFNPNTRSYDEYVWFSEVYTDDSYATSLGKAGWGNNYVMAPCTLNPGQGFWIRTEADCTVSFPSPL